MTDIMHFTHVRHLASIVEHDGLHCDRRAQERGLSQVNIAHTGLKALRARTSVPCGPGGTLADYVPHYFAPRSPMLYSLKMGNVEGYTGSQSDLIYLVATAEAVAEAGLPYVFTDGHGVVAFTEFYDDLRHLDEIDWDIMQATYWNDTLEDPDRKRRRQAEFLVHWFLPLALVSKVVVADQMRKVRVEKILDQSVHDIPVIVNPHYYF